MAASLYSTIGSQDTGSERRFEPRGLRCAPFAAFGSPAYSEQNFLLQLGSWQL
jgi:hypothetical protein